MIAKTIATAFNERVRRERFCARRTLIVNVPPSSATATPGSPHLGLVSTEETSVRAPFKRRPTTLSSPFLVVEEWRVSTEETSVRAPFKRRPTTLSSPFLVVEEW